MTVFSDAFVEHYRELKAQSGFSGTYRQLAKTGSITMVPAIGNNEQENTSGIIVSSKSADFLATVEDLKAISCWPPTEGDTFEYVTPGGDTRLMEVMPDVGERVFDFDSNSVQLAVRIHTKEISA